MSSLYSYDIHLPSQLDPDRTYPTIFTLHGKGSNEQDMFGVVESLSEEFIIIGIRGDLPMSGGFQYYELKSLVIRHVSSLIGLLNSFRRSYSMPQINIRLILVNGISSASVRERFCRCHLRLPLAIS